MVRTINLQSIHFKFHKYWPFLRQKGILSIQWLILHMSQLSGLSSRYVSFVMVSLDISV